MTDPQTTGAVVEIVDDKHDGAPLIPSHIYVNGVELGLVCRDGVTIEAGNHSTPTIMTLRFMPSQILMRAQNQAEQNAARKDAELRELRATLNRKTA